MWTHVEARLGHIPRGMVFWARNKQPKIGREGTAVKNDRKTRCSSSSQYSRLAHSGLQDRQAMPEPRKLDV
jgi:hypothetical protein